MLINQTIIEAQSLISRSEGMRETNATQTASTSRRPRLADARARARGAIGPLSGAASSSPEQDTHSAPFAWRLTPDHEILSRDVTRMGEALLLSLTSWAAAGAFSFMFPGPVSPAATGAWALALAAALLSFFVLPRHDADQGVSLSLNAAALFPALCLLVVLSGAAAALITGIFPAVGCLLLWTGLALPAVLLARALHRSHLRVLRRSGVLRERVAILACDASPEDALAHVAGVTRADIEIAGVWHGAPGEGSNQPGLDALIEQARRAPVDRVIVVARSMETPVLEAIVLALRSLDVDASLLCAGGPAIAGPLELELLRRPLRGWAALVKSIEDRAIALALMPLALPLMGLIALAIRLDSKGPALFRQNRHGRDNAEFRIFKFRTMEWRGEAVAAGARQTRRNDARVTRVGRILRAASLDELPQLFNVLRGEMSIVGPRPHPVAMRTENRLGHEIAPDYAQRHRVRPGLTGLAQINGSRGAMETAGQLHYRVEQDLRYIDNWSLSMDLGILALTPARLIFHKGKAF